MAREKPPHVRFARDLEKAIGHLDDAVWHIDEEGGLCPAAQAAYEAARASIIALGRAELSDPWWSKETNVDSVFTAKTPAESIAHNYDQWLATFQR